MSLAVLAAGASHGSPGSADAQAPVVVPAAFAPVFVASGSRSAKRPASQRRRAAREASAVVPSSRSTRVVAAPARPSFAEVAGLRTTDDPLNLQSSVALVVDADSNDVLFSKNPNAVLPIASITKLMTAMLVVDAEQPLDEVLVVTQDDVDTEKGSRSRLQVGTRLTRGEMLHLALMSSENRAASALGRHYPGGLTAFVGAMNARAELLGMHDSHFVEPTGLSSRNQSTAHDLALLVRAASQRPLIRELSTALEADVPVGRRQLHFRNTNALVRDPSWSIGLQKTGYISEAGRCVVMQAEMAGRRLIMVLLDSAGRYARVGDAERLRSWLSVAAAAAPTTAQPR